MYLLNDTMTQTQVASCVYVSVKTKVKGGYAKV
jgi:hypothetical protein